MTAAHRGVPVRPLPGVTQPLEAIAAMPAGDVTDPDRAAANGANPDRQDDVRPTQPADAVGEAIRGDRTASITRPAADILQDGPVARPAGPAGAGAARSSTGAGPIIRPVPPAAIGRPVPPGEVGAHGQRRSRTLLDMLRGD